MKSIKNEERTLKAVMKVPERRREDAEAAYPDAAAPLAALACGRRRNFIS